MFNADEFSLLLNGVNKIDVDDWKRYTCVRSFLLCDALRDLVPFVKFKKREKTYKTAENR